MESLKNIEKVMSGELSVLKTEKWLMYLYLTKETNVNLERVASISNVTSNEVLEYSKRTLQILEESKGSLINETDKYIIEEVLKWSEVAKCGMVHQRKQWAEKGYNLFAHNIGSAQIYRSHIGDCNNVVKCAKCEKNKTIEILIRTHGLVGQYVRGEVSLKESEEIREINMDKNSLHRILYVLNKCILKAVSEDLWEDVELEVSKTIVNVLTGNCKELTLKERIRRLRQTSINKGEDFEKEYGKYPERLYENIFESIFEKQLWYVESATSELKFEEFIKVFAILKYNEKNNTRHINLASLMKSMYNDYKGKKHINLFKKRIVEWYLESISLYDIITKPIPKNEHIEYLLEENKEVINFDFKFSAPAEKLIEFCMVANKSDLIYKKTTHLLYELFGFSKDKYDRFYNESTYLDEMNSSISHKSIILDYIVGTDVIDVGPGGGALMDMIEERYPEKEILGIDISNNVLEHLKLKKQRENKKWGIVQADILELGSHNEQGIADTIIFSSIIHELFSYVEYEGKKFNHDVIKKAIRNSFEALNTGGRIIIRDGIMTEKDVDGLEIKRQIRFKDKKGKEMLERFVKDFKGRTVAYREVEENPMLVEMGVNDAMEFLYTYTWGEESYNLEVQEQFGYYTPSEYREVIQEIIGDRGKIVELHSYLQNGYSKNLGVKIDFMDMYGNAVDLPDSTCIIVVEKGE